MRSLVNSLGAALMVFFAVCTSLATENVAQHLQDISVTVDSEAAHGSGVLITRTNNHGDVVNFVLTAGHFATHQRRETSVNVTNRIVVFDDVNVIKQIVENGRNVGQVMYAARIVKYSGEEFGDDLALLELYKRNFITNSATFSTNLAPVPPGTLLLHVGSLKGLPGAESLSSGIQSAIGRVIDNIVFDQTTVVVYPGSSGGGIYAQDGQCVGLVVRSLGPGFSFYVPLRRIAKWVERTDLKWVIDESLPIPTDEERAKIPVEEPGTPPVPHSAVKSISPILQLSPFR